MKHCDDYNNQRQSIESNFAIATKESEELYKIRLTCSLDCTIYLISQGISFSGHDEKTTSLNKGNFREMIDWIKSNNEQFFTSDASTSYAGTSKLLIQAPS